jgi:phytoene/squalene synthetase
MTVVHARQANSDAVIVAADAVLAPRGKSFHWARRLLSAPYAERATRLHGLCRHIDDLADEAVSPTAARAARAAPVAVRRALQAGHSDDLAMQDMLLLTRSCGIDAAIPFELVQDTESDLGEVCVADMAELLNYCYQVAGLPTGARAGILVAARTYRKIGIVLRKRDGDCWSLRAMVSARSKATITLHALASLSASGVFNSPHQDRTQNANGGPAMGLLPPRRSARWHAEASFAD